MPPDALSRFVWQQLVWAVVRLEFLGVCQGKD